MSEEDGRQRTDEKVSVLINLENLDEIESQGFSSGSKRKSKQFDSFNRKSESKPTGTQRQANRSTEPSEALLEHTQKSKKRGPLRRKVLRGFSSKLTQMSSSKFSAKVDPGSKNSNVWETRSFVPERKWTLRKMWKKEKGRKVPPLHQVLANKAAKASGTEKMWKLSQKGENNQKPNENKRKCRLGIRGRHAQSKTRPR